MSNFKPGDKVRRKPSYAYNGDAQWYDGPTPQVFTVFDDTPGQRFGGLSLMQTVPGAEHMDGNGASRGWDSYKFELVEAAPVPAMAPDVPPEAVQPSGHLPDGSSVQKHSAGGLYPCVLVWRDKQVHDGHGKYDVGVIIPGHDAIWCRDLDSAVRLGQAWLDGGAA